MPENPTMIINSAMNRAENGLYSTVASILV